MLCTLDSHCILNRVQDPGKPERRLFSYQNQVATCYIQVQHGLPGPQTLPQRVKPDRLAKGVFPRYQRGFEQQQQLPRFHRAGPRLAPLSSGAGRVLHGEPVKVTLLQIKQNRSEQTLSFTENSIKSELTEKNTSITAQ